MRRNAKFFALSLLVILLVAGVGSYYASAHPDGLNYVAEQTGFSAQEETSATADGPFAGYATRGIENPRLSGGVAGLVGSLTTLLLGVGIFWLLRRRSRAGSSDAA